MRRFSALLLASPVLASIVVFAPAAQAEACKLTPREVVSRFMDEFYVQKKVRSSFERWVDPGYIQHNPYAATGRDAAIAFLEPYFAAHPERQTEIRRIIADGDLVAVHSHGRSGPDDRGVAVVDIFRVEGCKVMEHWDVLQQVPETSANANTMF